MAWIPELVGWLDTRYDLADRVLRDPATFTVDDPRFSTSQVVGPSMLSLDGAAHSRHRSPFTAPFRPRDVEQRFAEFVDSEVGRLVAVGAGRGHAEIRQEISGPLAATVMAYALGLGETDVAEMLSWYSSIVAAVHEVTAGGNVPEAGRIAFDGLRAHVLRTLHSGLSSSLLMHAARGSADGDADPLTQEEIVSNAAVLLFGGIETTDGMIANLMLHVLSNPEHAEAIRADVSLANHAAEESLRLEPAAAVVDRYATRDVELAGTAIKAGDLVTVSIAGANRDPAVFPNPDTFDPGRRNLRQQLAFAAGPHFCLGAHLARLESVAALRGVLTVLPGLRLAPNTPSRPTGLIFRKPPELHVIWDATSLPGES